MMLNILFCPTLFKFSSMSPDMHIERNTDQDIIEGD